MHVPRHKVQQKHKHVKAQHNSCNHADSADMYMGCRQFRELAAQGTMLLQDSPLQQTLGLAALRQARSRSRTRQLTLQ